MTDDVEDVGEQAGRPPMPLAMATIGQDLVLAHLGGGKEMQHRLAEMGLTPGTRFRLLNRGQPGPFIILVKQTRLAIGRGMIHRVMVHPAED